MPATIYNWGRERKIKVRDGHILIPTQRLMTERGLVDTDIPVYEAPKHKRNISKGVYDYDPLGNA